MIVRLALPRPLVDVGENAEAELRILVEDLALGPVIAEMTRDEHVVLQHVLDERAHLPSALGPAVVREDASAGSGELLERVAHGADLPSFMGLVGIIGSSRASQ